MTSGKTEKIYHDCLKKIKKEQLFDKSPIYYDLLTYLVHATLRNEQPKELTIASDVFHKSPSSDKEISIRPYISNLRKKLKDYYQDAGSKNAYQLIIPKGRYTVQYVEKKRSIFGRKHVLLMAVFGILIVISIIINFSLTQKTNAFDSIWNGFLANEKETVLTLGDHFFFSSVINNTDTVFVRKTDINTSQEFEHYKLESQDTRSSRTDNTNSYLNPQTVYGVYYLMPLLSQSTSEVKLEIASRLHWNLLDDKNFIFFGSHKTLGILKDFVISLGLEYKIEKKLILSHNDSVQEISYELNYPREDIAAVIRFTTEQEKEVLIMISSTDFGNIAMVKRLTDKDWMREFESDLNNYQNFVALFRIKGEGTTDFTSELIHIDSLSAEQVVNWP